MSSPSAQLLNRRLLARNTLLNLTGSVLPILVALVAIPILIRGIGTERFGLLSLVWMFVGYFSLFDLGLGRATTKLVAEKIGAGLDNDVPVLFWTSSLLMTVVSLFGMVLLLCSSSWIVHSVLHIGPELETEAVYSFFLIAFSLPFIVHSSALRGFLTAYQRFGLLNIIRIPQGMLNFIGPLLVLPFTKNLVAIVLVLVLLRVISWGCYVVVCLYFYSELRVVTCSKEQVRPLLSFSSWMTVSNLISPIMVNLDRFFIGGIVSLTAVAYYTAPYQVVIKLLLVPIALQGVLFPALSHALALNSARAAGLFRNGVQAVLFFHFPVLLFAVMFAGEGMNLWIGGEFAAASTQVLQVLSVGVFFNGVAMVPFALIQGAGRPDLTAKLHLVELIGYIVLLWWLLEQYGIIGAAIAWTVRAAFDFFLLFVTVQRLFPENRGIANRVFVFIPLILCAFVVASQVEFFTGKVILLPCILFLFAVIFWFFLLNSQEQIEIKKYTTIGR